MDTVEPFREELLWAFDVKRGLAGSVARLDQLPRIIAGSSADHDDRIREPDQILKSGLSIFRRFADSIDEANLGSRICAADQIDNAPNKIDSLGCLRNDSVTLVRRKALDIFGRIHDNRVRKISDEPVDLDVPALADDDGKVSSRRESSKLFVSVVNERACRISDIESSSAPLRSFLIGSAMRRDHDPS